MTPQHISFIRAHFVGYLTSRFSRNSRYKTHTKKSTLCRFTPFRLSKRRERKFATYSPRPTFELFIWREDFIRPGIYWTSPLFSPVFKRREKRSPRVRIATRNSWDVKSYTLADFCRFCCLIGSIRIYARNGFEKTFPFMPGFSCTRKNYFCD